MKMYTGGAQSQHTHHRMEQKHQERRNQERRTEGKKRRRFNRTFTSFSLSKLISMIKSTAKKKRIAVVVTEESYTSLACFYDGDMPEKGVEFSGTRLTRSLYRTREVRMVNADINAALNIYRKCSPEAERLRCMGITCPRRLQVMNS